MALWERRLFYYLRRLADDEQEAWDILQQTWLKVIKGIPSIREPKLFKAWLYSIARRTAADRIRELITENNHRREEPGLEELADQNNGPEDFENASLVHYGLGKLPLEQREILTLFFLEEFSLSEIAGILRLPEGTVKSRLHRARAALRTVLEREGGAR